MRRAVLGCRIRVSVIVLSFALGGATGARADSLLEPGRYRGVMHLEGIPDQDISLMVTPPGEGSPDADPPSLELVTDDRTYAVAAVVMGTEGFSFTFDPGGEVACELLRQANGTFEGECLSEGHWEHRLRLTVNGTAEPAEVAPEEVAEAPEAVESPPDAE